MTSLSEARQKALEARKKMLDARPKDAISPLPDKIVPDHTNCVHYFETAAYHYLPRRNLDAGCAGGRLPRSGTVRISSYFRTL
jgi:hypothetical protein